MFFRNTTSSEMGHHDRKKIKLRHQPVFILAGVFLLATLVIYLSNSVKTGKSIIPVETQAIQVSTDQKFIKWVDFKITCEALGEAYDLDVASYESKHPVHWIELLAYVGARHGGEFPTGSVSELRKTAETLQNGETTIEKLTKELEYYPYYKEAYEAVLSGFVGEFSLQVQTAETEAAETKIAADGSKEKEWKQYYGLKAFSPIAKGFPYSDYDDFGVSRSYGYKREHLGHDMMGQIGTPVIAVESGYVEALGWNQYGGWRIGIRSFDKKRYYYYAHLRQNFPYALELKEGSVVTAGDVIGYMGHTGYSSKENVNNIDTVHLHWGLQLIFDESQKEGNTEIWVDCYQLSRFLYRNRSEAVKNTETKEWKRVYEMKDPVAEDYKNSSVRTVN